MLFSAPRVETNRVSPVSVSRAMRLCCGPFATSAWPSATAMSVGLPRVGIRNTALLFGSIRQTSPPEKLVDPDIAVAHRDRARIAADRDPLGGSVRLGVDPDEGVGAGEGRHATVTAREEEASEGGGDQRDPDGGHSDGPGVAFRLGDPERLAGVGDELAAGRVAVGGVLREGFGEYLLEAGQGGRVVFELGEQGGGVGAAAERRLAGEALVEEAAERVDVGAAVDLFAADLLGGDVVGGAERAAGAERGCRVAEVAAEPEVGKIDMPVLVEQHVRRLHVAMHETTGVSGVERARDLLHDPNGPGRLERPAAQHDLQVAADDEAHHDVELPVDLARVVDRHHVRMLQDAATRDSVKNRSRNETSSARCGASSFNATSRSSARSWAR